MLLYIKDEHKKCYYNSTELIIGEKNDVKLNDDIIVVKKNDDNKDFYLWILIVLCILMLINSFLSKF